MKTKFTYNLSPIIAALKAKLLEMTWREAKEQSGISTGVLAKIQAGKPTRRVDIDTLLRLANWLQIDPAVAFEGKSRKGNSKG